MNKRFLKSYSTRTIFLKIISKLLGVQIVSLEYKKIVLKQLLYRLDGKVANGLLVGMKLYPKSYWGDYDLIPKILGEYEKDILEYIKYFLNDNKSVTFIDIGAADGYYAVGLARLKEINRVLAFETDSLGQKVIFENAILNNVSNKISIYGQASESIISLLEDLGETILFLIDIEGGEYELLTLSLLDKFKRNTFIIELHPWLVRDGDIKTQELMSNANRFFNISFLSRKNYTTSSFPEFDNLTEEQQLLVMSEGRFKKQQWVVFQPKL